MDQLLETSLVPCGKDMYISKNELLSHLKNYNLYYEGQNLQLRNRERQVAKPTTIPDIQITETDDSPCADEEDARPLEEDVPQLMRTRSDVGVRRRGNLRTPGEQRRIKRHRFSINGHFYNHKTSVFTPAYGSITNVRINSTMSTPQVLKLLLNKFKVRLFSTWSAVTQAKIRNEVQTVCSLGMYSTLLDELLT
ncbi:hypothetical protein FKM82_012158 [Ascaphus truei]